MSKHPPDLFAEAAYYYARFRPPYPDAFFQHLVDRFGLNGTGRLLDLGCGTGHIAIPLAPHFDEAIGVDPDPSMLGEAADMARQAGVSNARWIQGRDVDLTRLSHDLGSLRLVTFGRAFHWMDQQATLQALEPLVEADGGIVIVADSERIWHVPGEWQEAVRAVIRRWLGDVRRAGSGVYSVRHAPFEESLAVSAFSQVERYSLTVERLPTIDDIVGYLYSTSYCSPAVLGDKRAAFEEDLRRTLAELSSSERFSETIDIGAWLARRP